MVSLRPKECFACSACINICPVKAIEYKTDSQGSKYAVVDTNKCIQCNLCEKVCQVYNPSALSSSRNVFALLDKDANNLKKVASGGAASILARKIFSEGGVVYGCAMLNAKTIGHVRCTRIEELELLKNSKYVQSDLGNVFKEIKSDLVSGKSALFIGTPCQVAGLKLFLGGKYEEKIYYIDLICHGVPDYDFLSKYLDEKFSSESLGDSKIFFRWKDKRGKVKFGIRLQQEDLKEITINSYKCGYMAAFFSGLSYRENCHTCPYSTPERIGDITVGDFWGLGNVVPSNLNAINGVSLVFTNTQKGEDLLNRCKDEVVLEAHSLEEAVKCNKNLTHPTSRPENKDLFFKLLMNGDKIDSAMKKCSPEFRRHSSPLWTTYLFFARTYHKARKILFK